MNVIFAKVIIVCAHRYDISGIVHYRNGLILNDLNTFLVAFIRFFQSWNCFWFGRNQSLTFHLLYFPFERNDKKRCSGSRMNKWRYGWKWSGEEEWCSSNTANIHSILLIRSSFHSIGLFPLDFSLFLIEYFHRPTHNSADSNERYAQTEYQIQIVSRHSHSSAPDSPRFLWLPLIFGSMLVVHLSRIQCNGAACMTISHRVNEVLPWSWTNYTEILSEFMSMSTRIVWVCHSFRAKFSDFSFFFLLLLRGRKPFGRCQTWG